MDLLAKARQLEAKLARTVDRATQQWSKSGPRGPLEIMHAILEAVEERIEPAGRGTHVFPFNTLRVSIVAGSPDARARFSGVLDGPPTLQERISRTLRDAGCAVLVVSEELDELFEICDRLHVVAKGHLSPSVQRADATVERIGEWMSGLWHADVQAHLAQAATGEAQHA